MKNTGLVLSLFILSANCFAPDAVDPISAAYTTFVNSLTPALTPLKTAIDNNAKNIAALQAQATLVPGLQADSKTKDATIATLKAQADLIPGLTKDRNTYLADAKTKDSIIATLKAQADQVPGLKKQVDDFNNTQIPAFKQQIADKDAKIASLTAQLAQATKSVAPVATTSTSVVTTPTSVATISTSAVLSATLSAADLQQFKDIVHAVYNDNGVLNDGLKSVTGINASSVEDIFDKLNTYCLEMVASSTINQTVTKSSMANLQKNLDSLGGYVNPKANQLESQRKFFMPRAFSILKVFLNGIAARATSDAVKNAVVVIRNCTVDYLNNNNGLDYAKLLQ